MRRPVIFLDDGGVMNDNAVRGPQWQRLVAEFFVPRLGGKAEAWHDANFAVINRILEPDDWNRRIAAATGYDSFDRAYHRDWLTWMCELVGLPAPPEEECVRLGREADAWITRRVHSAYPGAVEAIRRLHRRGHALHTASNESSDALDGYLEAMGVRDCFGRLFGPDLIETFKEHPDYYPRIFAEVGIRPEDALVVDDRLQAVQSAARTGALAVLVTSAPPPDLAPIRAIRGLAELPELIDALA